MFTKYEVIKGVRNCELLISKPEGEYGHKMEIIAKGSIASLVCLLGEALCKIGNQGKESATAVYCVCKAICEDYEENNGEDRQRDVV